MSKSIRRSRRARWPPLAFSVLLVGLLAGCGGGGSGSSTDGEVDEHPSTGLTKAEWIVAADAICRESRADTEEIKSRYEDLTFSTPREQVEGAELLREFVPKQEEETAQLRELPLPSDGEEILDSMISKVEDTGAIVGKVAAALKDGERSELEDLGSELSQENETAKGMAQGYGLEVCGSEE
jgi:hypothetical protein